MSRAWDVRACANRALRAPPPAVTIPARPAAASAETAVQISAGADERPRSGTGRVAAEERGDTVDHRRPVPARRARVAPGAARHVVDAFVRLQRDLVEGEDRE